MQTVDEFLTRTSLPKDFRDFVKARKNLIGHNIYTLKIKAKDARGRLKEW